MIIADMHYDFKKKLNKVDSQKYKNLLIPEIDWVLNEAAKVFVKKVGFPRGITKFAGFETSQRNIDDIRTIVIHEADIEVISNICSLPNDYWHFIRGNVVMTKGLCENTRGSLFVRQHDDTFEESPFDRSSFEWRTVNCVFTEDGIRVFTDGTFTVNRVLLSYVRQMAYMHYAEGFLPLGQYKLPSGEILSGSQNCELPDHTHEEIVDIAVLITSGELQSSGVQFNQMKLQLNQLN